MKNLFAFIVTLVSTIGFAQSSAVPAASGGILGWLPSGMALVVPALIAFNLILGGVKKLLDLIPAAAGADSLVGKISGWVAKIIDLLGGNVAHK